MLRGVRDALYVFGVVLLRSIGRRNGDSWAFPFRLALLGNHRFGYAYRNLKRVLGAQPKSDLEEMEVRAKAR